MFHHPWFLLLLPIVPWLGWRMWKASRTVGIAFSSVADEWDVRPTWRQRVAWLPQALLLASLTLMITALARPRDGREQTIINSEGIAIQLVVDRSSSMEALDFKIEEQHVDRLTAIKNVASKFVLGDRSEDGLGGRLSDLIGLIAFAGYADAITPLTLDHGYLISQLEQTAIVHERSEDGTAIGDAISLGVEKLNSLDQRQSEKIESKIIILLTDGENTAGELEPMQAAELASAMKIRIYTIGVGTKGSAPYPVERRRNGQVIVRQMPVNIDEDTLRAIAEKTGGRYFRATDTTSLQSIYEEIDKLEKTKVESQQYMDYRELAVQSTHFAGYKLPALLLIALLLLVVGQILSLTLLRQMTSA
jgi:Ca-activated chloride channel homolog